MLQDPDNFAVYGDRTMNKFKTKNYYRELNKDSLCSGELIDGEEFDQLR